MNEKSIKVAGLTKELLADLDKVFPEATPEINMDMKEIYFRIGQRSVVRFLSGLLLESSLAEISVSFRVKFCSVFYHCLNGYIIGSCPFGAINTLTFLSTCCLSPFWT